MKIAEQTPDRLVIHVDDLAFARALLGLFIVCAGTAVVIYLNDPRPTDTDRFWGALFGAVFFLVGFLAVYERAKFVFDRATHELVWQRRRAFTKRSGNIRFEQIRDVVIQTTGSQVNPKQRLTLLVSPDEELPLSVAYAPGASGSNVELRKRIQQFIEQAGA
jgi:hypothetical protein